MPALKSDVIGVALDMYGCRNRCRHCYLGSASGGHMTEDDLRWAVEQFRCFMDGGQEGRPWRKLQVSTWIREPDFPNDYKRLYELECELSDIAPERPSHELLSVWRAAHDPEYPHWVYDIGIRVGQILLTHEDTTRREQYLNIRGTIKNLYYPLRFNMI